MQFDGDKAAEQQDSHCTAAVTIRNRKGLHARASAKFVKCAEQFHAEISVTRDDLTVGGISIMGLLMLAASSGVTVVIEARGADAAEAVSALVALVEDGFGEGCMDCTNDHSA